MNSDTPRTDELFMGAAASDEGYWRALSHARQLERELNEARDAFARQQQNYIKLHDAVMGDGCHTSDYHNVDDIAKDHREKSIQWKAMAQEAIAELTVIAEAYANNEPISAKWAAFAISRFNAMNK